MTAALALGLSLLAVRTAHADSLTLMWDPNAEQVTGYVVYVGTQPGSLTQRWDVGNTTSYSLASVVAGQQYCFAVSAYFDPAAEGPKSTEVCGYSNRFPVLTKPANQSSTVGQAASLQLAGSDPDGQAVSYSASGLPPGLTLMTGSGFISGTPTTAGTYSVTASVSDGVLSSASQSFTWSVTAAATTDTTPPSVTITGPTTSSSYLSTTSSIGLSGTSLDNMSVTAVTWASDRGGSGTAVGTSSWSVPSISLQSGTNVITVKASDAAGNQATDTLTVAYTPPDTMAPAVSITGPTSSSSYTSASASVTLSGTASDNVGVKQVTWSNDRGGAGTAFGTTSWRAEGIGLQVGTNVITVRVADAAGNQSADTLTITYNPPDATAPSISILGPTSASSYVTTLSVVTLGGSSSDDRGVTAVTWSNDRGGSGFSSGTTSWSIPSVSLQGGVNVVTVTAQDAAGNKGTDVLTVTYSAPAGDTTAPAVTIASPTTSASYTASSSTLALSGTASDDVGVTQVSWVNDRGGSGTASGTTSWSVSSVVLQEGTNVITVTARDAVGNQTSDVLTVAYSAPASQPPDSFVLSGSVYSSGRWMKVFLRWTPVEGRSVDVYRNGVRTAKTSNNGSYADGPKGDGPFTYRVCVTGTSTCSNTITVSQ